MALAPARAVVVGGVGTPVRGNTCDGTEGMERERERSGMNQETTEPSQKLVQELLSLRALVEDMPEQYLIDTKARIAEMP